MPEVAEILDAMLAGDFGTAVPQARGLSAECLPELRSLLEASDDRQRRKLCYWILTHAASSTRSSEMGRCAAQCAADEESAALRLEALKAAGFTEGIEDSGVFEGFLDDRNRDIRLAAIDALGACTGASAEDALVRSLAAAAKPADMFAPARALARMCSPAVIPQVWEVYSALPRRKPNELTLSCLALAMARHPRDSSTSVVRGDLESGRLWQLGWACLNYVSRIASVEDAPIVVGSLDGVITRLKRGREVLAYAIPLLRDLHPTEICAGLAALQRSDETSLVNVVARLVPFWSDLSWHDHVWLNQHCAAAVEGLVPHPPP